MWGHKHIEKTPLSVREALACPQTKNCEHRETKTTTFYTFPSRHAEVMKKIIETVAEGGGELGVHMYPLPCMVDSAVGV